MGTFYCFLFKRAGFFFLCVIKIIAAGFQLLLCIRNFILYSLSGDCFLAISSHGGGTEGPKT